MPRVAIAAVVSSGLYAAALLLFAPVAMPFLLLVPFPGLVLATRAPAGQCALWFGLTASLIGLGLGGHAVPGFILPLGLPTLMMAVGIRRFWPFERAAVAGVVVWTLGILGLSWLTYGAAAAVMAAAREQLVNSFNLALSTSGSLGASENALALIEAERDGWISGLLEVLPALVVLTGALTVITNLVLLRSWAGVSRHVNLRLWAAPDVLIWALIVSGFGMFAPLPAAAVVARNMFLILLGCYFCQGLAIVSYYLDRFRLPRSIRIAGYALIAIQHVVTAMVLVLGVFDLWGNFRRLNVGPADVRFDTED